jgi:predicted nucleic acid-binding Zn ribbon protein
MSECNECGQTEWSLSTTSDPQTVCAGCGAVQELEGETVGVQVCAGWWRTRGGQLVEVKTNSGAAKSKKHFPWSGVLFGVYAFWQNNGRWSTKKNVDHRDLIERVAVTPKRQDALAGLFSEGVEMSVRHQQTVERYTQGRVEALALLENLREFIEEMPVADAHGAIPGVGYDYVNRFEVIREKLSDCGLLTDAMSE